MKIIIQDEKSKEEIIYNHILSNLSKEEQIKYLKNKVLSLEKEMKTRTHYIITFLLTFLLLCLGIILLTYDFYVFGILLIGIAFLFITCKWILTIHSCKKEIEDTEFSKIEDTKKALEKKLK